MLPSPLDSTEAAKISLSNQDQPEWIEVELTAGPRACDTITPRDMAKGISRMLCLQSLSGLKYEGASGESVPNLEKRCCHTWTEGTS